VIPQLQHLGFRHIFRHIQIRDHHVEMHLLRMVRIRPLRPTEVGDALQSQAS
jgi:hypothetical protein